MRFFGPFKRKGREASTPAGKDALAEVLRNFILLQKMNDEALELMADMEGKSSDPLFLDRGYTHTASTRISERVRQMADCIARISSGDHRELMDAYRRVHTGIQEALEKERVVLGADYTLPLRQAGAGPVEQVGGKGAGLGRAIRLGLPVPDGFVVTAFGYLQFLSHNNLSEKILSRLDDPAAQEEDGLRAAASDIKFLIIEGRLPPGMEDALMKSAETLSGASTGASNGASTGASTGASMAGLALRSSAAMEDGPFSFAGQYATFLNVPLSELVRRYKEIAASQYSVEALSYMLHHGLAVEDIAMAVICQRVIPARVSGVLFTSHSSAAHGETMLVNAVFGLGRFAVEGTISPDFYVLDKGTGRVAARSIPAKTRMLVIRKEGGTEERAVPESLRCAPCLDPGALETLWKWGLELEKHFGKPQDMEWAMDDEGGLSLIQTRALRAFVEPDRKKAGPAASRRVLLEGGQEGSSGVGSGPVVLVRSEKDLRDFPRGSVLVAPQTSPKFVLVMDRTAAIVTDIGSATGHMAVLAREFRVPLLVDTQVATQVLAQVKEVTVDADHQRVYEGRVEELLEASRRKGPPPVDTPVSGKLKEVLKLIVPLHLTDPQSDTFNAASVRTLHDITRLVHEMAIREMLNLSLRDETHHVHAIKIKTTLPLHLFALDLGGGLTPDGPDREGRLPTPDAILSVPFQALWRGMTAPGVNWAGPIGVDTKGLLSVMTRSATRPGEEFDEKTLAILSLNYLNFSSRLGYHFSTVDSYCGEARNDNYVAFFFQGGAADRIRRQRRARFIGAVLERLGFDVSITEDVVRAGCRKYPRSMTEEKLEHLGRLMGCYRQLDMVMADDDVVGWYTDAFLSGNYSFRRGAGP